MNVPERRNRAWSRPRVLAAAGVVLAVAALVVAGLLAGRPGGAGRDTASPSPAATSASIPPAPPTPTPSGPTRDADALPPTLPAVQFARTAAVGNGITGAVVSLEAINGKGQGPGNIAGPALRATIRLTNGTAAPVSVDAVAVALDFGTDHRPASPLQDPSARPFHGTVAPGESATGVYVFTVPANDRSVITVSVGYQAGAPFMVFTGSAR